MEDKINLNEIQLSDIQKYWLLDEVSSLMEQHYGAAANEHIWALGSQDDEEAELHESTADAHREYAQVLKSIADVLA